MAKKSYLNFILKFYPNLNIRLKLYFLQNSNEESIKKMFEYIFIWDHFLFFYHLFSELVLQN